MMNLIEYILNLHTKKLILINSPCKSKVKVGGSTIKPEKNLFWERFLKVNCFSKPNVRFAAMSLISLTISWT